MKDTIILANPNPRDIEKLDSIVRPYFATSVAKNDIPKTNSSPEDTFEDAACEQAVAASEHQNEFAVSSRGGEIDNSDAHSHQWRQAIALAHKGKLLFSTEVGSDMISGNGLSQPELRDQSWQRLKQMFDWYVKG